MRCRICGRKITDPDSTRNGIGPVCYQLIYGKKEDAPEVDEHFVPLPGQMTIEDFLKGGNDGTADIL